MSYIRLHSHTFKIKTRFHWDMLILYATTEINHPVFVDLNKNKLCITSIDCHILMQYHLYLNHIHGRWKCPSACLSICISICPAITNQLKPWELVILIVTKNTRTSTSTTMSEKPVKESLRLNLQWNLCSTECSMGCISDPFILI